MPENPPSRHHNQVLDPDKVRVIRILLHRGFKQIDIARAMRLSHQVINDIARGKTYKNIK